MVQPGLAAMQGAQAATAAQAPVAETAAANGQPQGSKAAGDTAMAEADGTANASAAAADQPPATQNAAAPAAAPQQGVAAAAAVPQNEGQQGAAMQHEMKKGCILRLTFAGDADLSAITRHDLWNAFGSRPKGVRFSELEQASLPGLARFATFARHKPPLMVLCICTPTVVLFLSHGSSALHVVFSEQHAVSQDVEAFLVGPAGSYWTVT